MYDAVPRTAQQGQRRSVLSKQAWLIVLTTVLVFLVALGSRRSFANVSSSRALLDARVVLGDLLVILGAVLAAEFVLLVYVWVSYLRKRNAGGDPSDALRSSSWGQRLIAGLAAIMLFAMFIGIAARGGDGDSTALPGLLSPSPLPLVGGSEAAPQPFVIHWWILLALALLGLAGVLLLVLIRRRRDRRAGGDAGTDGESPERIELLATVEASLEDLEDDPDPREAVIRAYVGLEQTLSQHGLARRPSEAPLEYLARWTRAVRVSRPPAETLTRLYERARFGHHVVDESTRRQAVAAFLTLRHELGEGERAGEAPAGETLGAVTR